MKYILNYSLAFTPEQKSLVLLNNGDSELTLSAPASRLLVELIKSNGTTISRDELLKNVWEDYGFVGSNSNLNSYISEIRKAFTSLGCDSKMIVTIPKSGLQFSANVETVLIAENTAILTESAANHQKQPLMETTDVSGERNKIEDNNSYNTKKFMTSGKIIIIFTMIVLCTVLAIFYVNVENPKVLPRKKTVFLFKENNCSVYSLGNRGEKSLDDLIKTAKADLKQNNIICTVQRENILHERVFENNTLSSHSFISRCTINNEGKATYCKTLIRYGRQD